MKAIFFLMLVLVVFACNRTNKSQSYVSEKRITIVGKQKYVNSLLKLRKENDVIIYRIDPCPEMHFNYGYAIVVFKNEQGGVKRRFDFAIASKDIYDQAVYKWKNDTTLKMKLYNSEDSHLLSEHTEIFRPNGGILLSEPYD
jgi:hypothetical protein